MSAINSTLNPQTALVAVDDYDVLRNGFEEIRDVQVKKAKGLAGLFQTNQTLGLLVFEYLKPVNPKNPSMSERHALVVFRDFYRKLLPGTTAAQEKEANSMGLNAEQRTYIMGMHLISQKYRHRGPEHRDFQRLTFQVDAKGNKSWHLAEDPKNCFRAARVIEATDFHRLTHNMIDFLDLEECLAGDSGEPDFLQELLDIDSLNINDPLLKTFSCRTPLGYAVERENAESVRLIVSDARFDVQREFPEKVKQGTINGRFVAVADPGSKLVNLLEAPKARIEYLHYMEKEVKEKMYQAINEAYAKFQDQLTGKLWDAVANHGLHSRDLTTLIAQYAVPAPWVKVVKKVENAPAQPQHPVAPPPTVFSRISAAFNSIRQLF